MADAPKRIEITGGNITPAKAQGAFQPKSSYVQRLLEVTVKLAPDQGTGQPIKFAGTGSDAVTLSGFRTSVRIENSGSPVQSAHVTIWGLNDSLMNQLSTLGKVFNLVPRNLVTISAGDAENGLSPVFSGVAIAGVRRLQQDAETAVPLRVPDRIDRLDRRRRGLELHRADRRRDHHGGAGAPDEPRLREQRRHRAAAGLLFPGHADAAGQEVRAGRHINAERVDADSKLAIWPIGGSRTSLQGQNIPLISKDTGMIGYPSFAPNGYIIVNALFNPQVAFGGTHPDGEQHSASQQGVGGAEARSRARLAGPARRVAHDDVLLSARLRGAGPARGDPLMGQQDSGYGHQTPGDTNSELGVIEFACRRIVGRDVDHQARQGDCGAPGAARASPPAPSMSSRSSARSTATATARRTARSTGCPGAGCRAAPTRSSVTRWSATSATWSAADRDISTVKSTKAAALPGSRRQFDIADGVYAGGCLNVAPEQYLIFTDAGVRLVDKNGNSVTLNETGVQLSGGRQLDHHQLGGGEHDVNANQFRWWLDSSTS
jgi:hypothetical protein